MKPQFVLGSGIRARALMAHGEGLLWAAGTKLLGYHVRGLQLDGQPQKGLASRVGMGLADMAGDVLAAAVPPGDGGDSPDNTPRPDVAVFGQSPDQVAVQYARMVTEPAIWCLTTHRLLIAVDVPKPAAEPEPSRGFFGELAKLGRDVATSVATPTDDGHGRPTLDPGLRPLTEVPRAQIAGLSITGNPPVLRLTLADGSGFDFLNRGDRAALERAVALANGASE
ncbi:MAG TPA: hypothetical protein VM677_23810 [Actinokineospora sp.]|jgi:hypothetical protein|nr:hypothetical protein [Actinokineospora sp.]